MVKLRNQNSEHSYIFEVDFFIVHKVFVIIFDKIYTIL